MTEIRTDPITGRQVILATDRGQRPSDLKLNEETTIVDDYSSLCPFCKGNEEKTPSEVDRHIEQDRWTIRVVPNKYPALTKTSKGKEEKVGFLETKVGYGTHEVIIESPKHNQSFFHMNSQEFEQLLQMYKRRYRENLAIDNIQYVSIFKNYKKMAGASLAHPHSQLLALPLVPKRIQEELSGSQAYYDEHDRCIYCDLIKEEIKQDERIIMDSEDFIVLAPYVSIFKYEMVILPKKHQSQFIQLNQEQEKALAKILQMIFRRVYTCLGDVAFNMFLHTSPKLQPNDGASYHWHFCITPRLSNHAGFEVGSDMYINSISPEDVANRLRGTAVSGQAF